MFKVCLAHSTHSVEAYSCNRTRCHMQKDGEDPKLLNVQFLSAAGKTEIPGQVSDAQCSTLVAVFIAITAHIL